MDARALVLAGLARCSLTSLRYHCVRAGDRAHVARASAHGTVTRRESDGTFAFVEIAVRGRRRASTRSRTTPTIAELLAKAERDCFVGASLTAAADLRRGRVA